MLCCFIISVSFMLLFLVLLLHFCFFFFNDTATTEIYTYWHTLSLHDALPISQREGGDRRGRGPAVRSARCPGGRSDRHDRGGVRFVPQADRKSTRLNSSH